MEARDEVVFLIDKNEMSMIAIDKGINDAKYLDISGGYKAKEVPLALYQCQSGETMAGNDAYMFMEEAGTFYTAKELHQEPQIMTRFLEECMNKVREIYPKYSNETYKVIYIPVEVPDSIQEYKSVYKNKIAETLEIAVEDKGVERLFHEHQTMWLKQLKTGKSLRVPLVYDGKMSVLELTADWVEPLRLRLREDILAWRNERRANALVGGPINNEYSLLANLLGIDVDTTDWLQWSLSYKEDEPIAQATATLYYRIKDKEHTLNWDIRQPITWVAMDGVHTIDVVDAQGSEVFTGLLPKALHGYLVTMKATLDNHHIISEVTYEFRKL